MALVLICALDASAQQVPSFDSLAATDTTAIAVVATDSAAALPAPVPLRRRGPSDREEVSAYFDGLLEALMDQHHIAGAALVLVQGDSVFLARGYGVADVTGEIPVDPATTLFRLGSVSKLFVWTAVMQLAADGKLDLGEDVNTYLTDVQVPAAFGEPITLVDLMTHTPGFEDRVLGLFARDASRMRPLRTILQEEMPARVWPPGTIASYSNHGVGIAAHIVEEVSGLSFNEYVEQHILGPLGMTHTTFRQPVPDSLAAGLSRGYSFENGVLQEEWFEFVPAAPVGGASASAIDMARFMRAHLNEGRLGKDVVLDSATARQMQQPLFYPAPGVNPMAHGFIDMSRNGERVIGHGGDTFWFHTQLALLPQHGVGLFVSFNSEGGGSATGKVFESFMDRYYPTEDLPEVSQATSRSAMERFAGAYRGVRYSHTLLTKMSALFFTVSPRVTDEGRLVTDVPERKEWVQTGPLTFREVDGTETLVFVEDDDGDVTHLYFGSLPILAFERIGWWVAPAFQGSLAGGALLLFLAVVLLMPLAALLRKKHGIKPDSKTRIPIAARGMAWLVSLGFLVFAVGLGLTLVDPNGYAVALPASMPVLLWFPIVAGALSVGLVLYAAVIWIMGWGRFSHRLGLTLLSLVCLAFLGQLYYWNLLGFHY